MFQNKEEKEQWRKVFNSCVNNPNPEQRTIIGYLKDKNGKRCGLACAFRGTDGGIWLRWSKVKAPDVFCKYEGFKYIMEAERQSIKLEDVLLGREKSYAPEDMKSFIILEMIPRAIKYFGLVEQHYICISKHGIGVCSETTRDIILDRNMYGLQRHNFVPLDIGYGLFKR